MFKAKSIMKTDIISVDKDTEIYEIGRASCRERV